MTTDTLPKLPEGVEWCGRTELNPHLEGYMGVWFEFENLEYGKTDWYFLSEQEKAYAAARCAMWWERRIEKYIDDPSDVLNQDDTDPQCVFDIFSTRDAWRELWRRLEDGE